MQHPRTGLLALAAACLIAAPRAGAQSLSFRAGAGVSFPVDYLAKYRRPGPHLSMALERRRPPGASLGARAELTLDRFPGRTQVTRFGEIDHGDFTVVSVLTHLTYGWQGPRVGTRLAVGGGVHSMRITGETNPYGLVPGVGISLNTDWQVGRVGMYAQAGAHTILSDFAVSEWAFTSFVPLTVGVRF